jgi:hypothetical protein
VITGTTAGNIFGQLSLFWSKIVPYSSREGLVKFHTWNTATPDSFTFSAPNQHIYNIAGHFQGLYPIIIGGSLVFHLLYGALAGFLSGRMVEIWMFIRTRNNAVLNP